MADIQPNLLVGALQCEQPWIRMGAVLTIAEANAHEYVPLLKTYWSQTEPTQDEFWIVVIGLARLDATAPDAIARAIGLGNANDLDQNLNLDWDSWVTYWRQHRPPSYVAVKALEELWTRNRAKRRSFANTHDEESLEPKDDYSPAANILDGRLNLLEFLYGAKKHEIPVLALIGDILHSLQSGNRELQKRAVDDLLRISLTEPERAVRNYIAPVFGVLPDPNVVDGLLRGLLGQPPYVPSAEQITQMQKNAVAYDSGPEDVEILSVRLASTFACETLEQFSDDDTAWRIAKIATRSDPLARARAEGVLFGMDCDVSLAALFGEALLARNKEERLPAQTIMEAIVSDQFSYDVPIWRVSGKLFKNLDFAWLTNLINQITDLPSWSAEFAPNGPYAWARHRITAQALVRNAIGSAVHRFVTTDIHHSASGTWDTYAGGLQELRQRWRRWRGPETTRQRGYSIESEFPERCPPGRPIALVVRFRPSNLSGGESTDFTVDFSESDDIALTVLVYSTGFQVSPRHLAVHLTSQSKSTSCAFQLTGIAAGRQLIEIEVMRGAEQLAYLTLFASVEQESGAPSSPVLVTECTPSLECADSRAMIEVDWQPGIGAAFSLWDAAKSGEGPKPIGSSLQGLSLTEIAKWSTAYSSSLREYITYAYKTDQELDAARYAISSIGSELFDMVIPKDLANAVRTWPAGSIIGIWTNEQWIPWELLCHDVQLGVWSEHFQIVRLPRIPKGLDESDLSNLKARDPFETVEISSAISAVGDGIPLGNLKGLFSVKRTFPKGCAVTDLQEPAINSLIAGAANADILHLTCHGRHDQNGGFYLSLGPDLLKRFLPEHVKTMTLKPGAMVFANACSSGEPNLHLGEFVNFGWRFYRSGARPFIGTLGPVPVEAAIDLAERFYYYFLVEQRTAGMALRAAKQEVSRRHRNPFGMLYCLYGQASIRREIRISATGQF
jgi:CHAT domain